MHEHWASGSNVDEESNCNAPVLSTEVTVPLLKFTAPECYAYLLAGWIEDLCRWLGAIRGMAGPEGFLRSGAWCGMTCFTSTGIALGSCAAVTHQAMQVALVPDPKKWATNPVMMYDLK